MGGENAIVENVPVETSQNGVLHDSQQQQSRQQSQQNRNNKRRNNRRRAEKPKVDAAAADKSTTTTAETKQDNNSSSSNSSVDNNTHGSSKKQQPAPAQKKSRRPPPTKETKKENDQASTSATEEKRRQPRQHPRFTKNRAQGKLTDDSTSTTQKNGENNKSKKGKGVKKPVPVEDYKDLSSALTQGLRTSTYECMVCWDVIRPAHATWACDCCWAVFHLPCVTKWATRSLEDKDTNKPVTQWRCPGCQFARTSVPKEYFCFCGKEQNPEANRYLTPHTCGQLCHRPRSCPHKCILPCHPGPCPPCTAMGPVQTCFCGQHTRQTTCVETDYNVQAYTCGEVCGELLGCEKHYCAEPCHPGLCPPCPTKEEQSCFCGKESKATPCGSGRAVRSADRIAFYACENKCKRPFACGQHFCQKTCHPQDNDPETCPFDPRLVEKCPCGSSSIKDLLGGKQRETCADPIPTCESTCGKALPCGHSCSVKCHLGDCPPCLEQVQVPCRCGNSNFSATCSDVCKEAGGDPPRCNKVCRSMRNCGRHQCKVECCPASKSNKGSRRNILPREAENVHECPEICGRTLSCGKHTCQERCHKGKCQPCLEAVFDEVTCHCGRTRLDPPVRCGTPMPSCPHPCQRPAPCGHVRLLNHNCHPDLEPCPPCAMLVTRTCVCGKTELKNVPCYRQSPRCGRTCDKLLPCGHHTCIRSCHGGPCLQEGQVCTQPCPGKREKCGHPCNKSCHNAAATKCPENEPCQAPVRVACRCGQNSLTVSCNATTDSPGSKRELECNDFCAKIERNRKLALALELDKKADELVTPTTMLSTDDLGYYDESLCNFFLENKTFCKQIEKLLIDFVQGTKQTLHCKPMKRAFRRFLHRYSIHFNVATEAVDPEPYRSVILRKALGQTRIPATLLSVAAHYPTLNRPPPQTAATAENGNTDESAHLGAAETPMDALPVTKLSKHSVNALLLSNLSFGLIKEDLDFALEQALGDIPFASEWRVDLDAVVVTPQLSDDLEVEAKEDTIWRLKKIVAATVMEFAARVDCCWVDQHGKLTWTEAKGILGNDPENNKEQENKVSSSSSSVNIFDALADHGEEQEA